MVGVPVGDPRSSPRFRGLGGAILVSAVDFSCQRSQKCRSHKDCGCPGHNPRSCHGFPCRRCQRVSDVPTVAGMVGVLISILVTVTIVDVAKFDSANAHKDGGCLNNS